MENKRLIELAEEAMELAYAPYSNFKVGAALCLRDGTLYTGSNVENSSYPVGCCAERVAIFKAVSDGERDFAKIAIVGCKDGKISDYTYPCGMCRQTISEFCGPDFKIILFNGKEQKEFSAEELLPYDFTYKLTKKEEKTNDRNRNDN